MKKFRGSLAKYPPEGVSVVVGRRSPIGRRERLLGKGRGRWPAERERRRDGTMAAAIKLTGDS